MVEERVPPLRNKEASIFEIAPDLAHQAFVDGVEDIAIARSLRKHIKKMRTARNRQAYGGPSHRAPKVLLRLRSDSPEYRRLEQLWVEIKMLEVRQRNGRQHVAGGEDINRLLGQKWAEWRGLRDHIAQMEREDLIDQRGAAVSNALLLAAYRLIREITLLPNAPQLSEQDKVVKNLIKNFLAASGENVYDDEGKALEQAGVEFEELVLNVEDSKEPLKGY